MITKFNIVPIAIAICIGLAGCTTYQSQVLPSAADIASPSRAYDVDKRKSTNSKSLSAIAYEVARYNPDLRAMRQDLTDSESTARSIA